MSFNAEELLASLTNAGGGDNKLMPSADLNLVLEIANALKKFSVDGIVDKMDFSSAAPNAVEMGTGVGMASNGVGLAPGSYRYPENVGGAGDGDGGRNNSHLPSLQQQQQPPEQRSVRSEGNYLMSPAELSLTSNSRTEIMSLLRQCPINHKERQELFPLPPTFLRQPYAFMGQDGRQTSGRINSGIPQKVPPIASTKFLDFRKSLPIWGMRNQIIQSIWTNQVILITGASGSGKSTQVPQFIMETCEQRNEACRIICTQPRRLMAMTVSERIALERDETVGQR